MGLVFEINEDLALVAVTATELLSVTETITGLIRNESFLQQFKPIIAEINRSYGVVLDSFAPFQELDNEETFVEHFDEKHAAFKGGYLMDVSKPRKYCDNVYDAYIAMQQTKEAKTSFPVLRQTFARLDRFYDKWITNDAMLAMCIDGALKLKNRLLNEIAEINAKDSEDGYRLFASAFDDFGGFLELIRAKRDRVAQRVASSGEAATEVLPAVEA